jgi:hypothetical protein
MMPRHDVQPAHQEPPPSGVKPDEVPAQRANQDDDDDQENDACCKRPVQALKKGCHGMHPPCKVPA